MLFMRNDVYKKVLQKGFHKISLSLLDLCFQNFTFQGLDVEAKKERNFGLARQEATRRLSLRVGFYLLVRCCIIMFLYNCTKRLVKK